MSSSLVFSPKKMGKLVRAITGKNLSYRQIQYWDKTGYVVPAIKIRNKYRHYTFPQLVLVCLLVQLREIFSVQELRATRKQIEEGIDSCTFDLHECSFYWDRNRFWIMHAGPSPKVDDVSDIVSRVSYSGAKSRKKEEVPVVSIDGRAALWHVNRLRELEGSRANSA